MNFDTKRTWAEVSLGNLEHNIAAIRSRLPSGCRFLGVVKADAYGHGAVPVARRMEKVGVDYLATACVDEAIELRRAGIELPILILGSTPPEYTGQLVEWNITQAVGSAAEAEEYSRGALAMGRRLRVHIKADTGMGRLGFLCRGSGFEAAADAIEAVCRLPGLEAEGIFTHMACSDEPGPDCRERTLEQFDLFVKLIGLLKERGIEFSLRHCANSGAVISYPEMALDMVRPGILTYGYGDGGKLGLKPCMSLKSRIYAVKDYGPGMAISYGGTYVTDGPCRMAVIPVGYGDGLLRCLSNRCEFYVCGVHVPQRGRICMDMCMADITDVPGAGMGSQVEIFGENAGLEKLCRAADTISYELLCAVSKRIPRVYK